MGWQLAQRRGTHGRQNAELAAEVLRSLFQGSNRPRSGPWTRTKPKQKEWECPTRHTPNYMQRGQCRRCSAARPHAGASSQRAAQQLQSQVAAGGSPAVQKDSKSSGGAHGDGQRTRASRPAPWANTEAAEKQANGLAAALDAVRAIGGCEDLEGRLTAELETARKRAKDTRPLLARVEGTRAYIERAEKRLESLNATAAKAQAAADAATADLAAHRERLQAMESEAAAELALAGSVGAQACREAVPLEEDVRALLHVLESSALVCSASGQPPLAIAERMTALHARVSIPEASVPAARLDEPMSDGINSPSTGIRATASNAEATVGSVAGSCKDPLLERLVALGEEADDAAYASVARAFITERRSTPD